MSAAPAEAALSEGLATRCRRTIEALGLARASEVRALTPLSGGVASDIVAADLGDRTVCLKFALARLRVAEEWRAPTRRSRAEHAWLAYAGSVVPEAAPGLLGYCEETEGFAMEWIAGEGVREWKRALLAGEPDRGEAERVGHAIGCIHAASAAPGFDRAPFENRDDFRALRLEPYLSFTAGRHPDLAGPILAAERALHAADGVLIHGDLSPKNVLLRDGAPVLLDAECASMGDPAFDLAFCLNHLCLKALHMPGRGEALLASAWRLLAAHATRVTWEAREDLDARVARLLPMLMLARVDGKSPVEYLGPEERTRVRAFARGLIAAPRERVADVLAALS